VTEESSWADRKLDLENKEALLVVDSRQSSR